MSKRGAAERDYAATQSNLRRARVEVRRVDAIQILMSAARARSGQASQSPQVPQPQQATAAATTTTSAGGAPQPQPQPQAATQQQQQQPQQQPGAAAAAAAPAAPCTHCGAVLPVSSDACCLRQCSGCYDVFCSLCSVPDYEEREDRVFCFSCLDDQTAASRRGGSHAGGATPRAGGGSGSAAGGGGGGGGGGGSFAFASCHMHMSSMALPSGGAATAGRWGQLDALLGTGAGAGGRSPFPCSATRTPQHGGTAAGGGAGGVGGGGSRTPGSAIYSSRSHRGFSALLAFGGAGS